MATENNNKNLNVPNLRFPEFSEEWSLEELKDIATLSKGSGISKDQLSDSGNPCILYGELYTKYKSEIIREVVSKTDIDSFNLVQSKANDVIIPCSGEAAIEIATARCVTMDDILLGGDLNIIRLNDQDGGFFAYQLNGKRKVDIAKVAQGVSVVHLYGEHLKRVKVAYPSLMEQQKISSFLTLLDERIATQIKIIEDLKKLKSAISNKLFARKDLLEKQITISEIGTLKNGYAFQSSTYNPAGNHQIITIANVSGERYIDVDSCNCIMRIPDDIQVHQVLKKDDILISLTGNVGRVSLCIWGNCLLNQRVGLLQLKQYVNREYVYQALSSKRFEQAMIACGQGAAQMNIGKGDVEDYTIPYSCNVLNMELIASTLKTYDLLISVEVDRLRLFYQQKQYLLAQMFI